MASRFASKRQISRRPGGMVVPFWVAAVIDTQIINPDPNASDDGVFVNAFAISFTTAVGMLPAVFLGSLARSIDKRYRLKRLVSQLPGRPAHPGY